MRKLLTLFVITIFITQVQSQITIYQDSNYRGDSKYLNNNRSSLDGYWNDKISSIRVPEGYIVTVYEHSDYRGRSKEIDNDWSIGSGWWNDKISSIKITDFYDEGDIFGGDSYSGDRVTIYKDSNYRGGSKELSNSSSDLGSSWNDKISSIRIPEGYIVTVYEHSDYRGSSKEIDNDWSIGSGWWNDKISSIKITDFYDEGDIFGGDSYSGDRVTIYKDSNYRGGSKELSNSSSDLGGSWNDKISSIRIPEGYIVTVYEHSDYRGSSKEIDNDWSIGSGWWNDKISSIKITDFYDEGDIFGGDSYSGDHVTIYKDSNYRGGSKELSNSSSDLGGSWNDKISSIRVPEGYVVTVYEHANFQGRSKDIDNDWSIGSGWWNDKISSIKITKFY